MPTVNRKMCSVNENPDTKYVPKPNVQTIVTCYGFNVTCNTHLLYYLESTYAIGVVDQIILAAR
jgi:hypothetical protein